MNDKIVNCIDCGKYRGFTHFDGRCFFCEWEKTIKEMEAEESKMFADKINRDAKQ